MRVPVRDGAEVFARDHHAHIGFWNSHSAVLTHNNSAALVPTGEVLSREDRPTVFEQRFRSCQARSRRLALWSTLPLPNSS
jgi:hypothetical protein